MTDEEYAMADLERRMRAKLNAPKTNTPAAEAKAIERTKKEPLPKKVLVQRIEEVGDDGVYRRWFFFAVQPDGSRKQILNTTHQPTAKKEAERYRQLGVELEEFKEF